MSIAMSLGEVSITDLPDSLNHLSEFEPWNIEDNDLTDLFRSISDKIPIDYEGSEIRLIGKKIFIRNRTRESWLGNITMIPSSNLPEPEIWPVEDLFVITIDQHFLEEDGCPEEKLRERWKTEMKDNLRNFAGFDTQPFEFEIHNRNEYPVEDEFLEHRQPRIRIDMQYIDKNTKNEEISAPNHEWTVSYFLIEKSIKGEQLNDIIERIIGNENNNIQRPGILILVREKDSPRSHLTHAMNMMYKASVAMTIAGSELNINEIFLNAVWNEFGNQKHSRMHD